MQQNNKLPGLYIAVVGTDGSGKTTLINKLDLWLKEKYPTLIITTREPGGTPKAESLREIIKSKKINPYREAELFANARASSLTEIVRPALKEGKIIISDRCVICSIVYQGIGRGLGIKTVEELNENAVKETYPDIVVWLNVNPEACIRRLLNTKKDHFDESDEGFFRTIAGGYGQVLNRWKQKLPDMKVIEISDKEGVLPAQEIFNRCITTLRPEVGDWYKNREINIQRERGR